MSYFDDQTRERFIPHVVEPSAGVDRAILAFLCEAYTVDEIVDAKGVPQERVLMKLHPRLAPIKAAVFPLVKREGMPEVARDIYRELKSHWNVFYDESGSVGRRYLRDRDTTQQQRVPVQDLTAIIRGRLGTS
jgi:glycyl-tRNA synthetase